jgi:hypothetical protein
MAMAGAGRAHAAVKIAAAATSKQAEIGKGTDAWWASMQARHLGAARSGTTGADAADAAAARARAAVTPFETVVAELVGGRDA